MDELIKINNINKRFNEEVIFEKFDMNFYKNKVNCILGKSGCGKTTLLKILSGIILNDTEYSNELESFKISYIFQEDRLIDWLSIEENITITSKSQYDEKELRNLCDKYLNLVGLKEYKNSYPRMLSGGMRQRVNIVRGFIYPSDVIIMDEPFKSIDIKNKEIIMKEVKNILKKEKRTVIFVTHDIEEALYLGEKIIILGGRPISIKTALNNQNITKEEIYKFI